jgi:membrane protease YdiL (CAAX protease family)
VSTPDETAGPDPIRLAAFVVAMSLTIVASELGSPGLEGISPRFLFGLVVPVLLGVLLTARTHRLGFGVGVLRRGVMSIGLGLPLVLAAMASLASLDAVRMHYGTSLGSASTLARHYLPGVFQVEACFRGVLLFGLVQRLSPMTAAAVTTLPYGLIHLDKPAAEAFGSIPVGFALAALALWTRSIWYGVALHWLGAIVLTLLVQRSA